MLCTARCHSQNCPLFAVSSARNKLNVNDVSRYPCHKLQPSDKDASLLFQSGPTIKTSYCSTMR